MACQNTTGQAATLRLCFWLYPATYALDCPYTVVCDFGAYHLRKRNGMPTCFQVKKQLASDNRALSVRQSAFGIYILFQNRYAALSYIKILSRSARLFVLRFLDDYSDAAKIANNIQKCKVFIKNLK